MKFNVGDKVIVAKRGFCSYNTTDAIDSVGSITEIIENEEYSIIYEDGLCYTCTGDTECFTTCNYADKYLELFMKHNRNGANNEI